MNDVELTDLARRAEQALLGSLLLDRDAIAVVAGTVPLEAFGLGRHRVLWAAARKLWDKREPIDPITLIAEVRMMGIGQDRLADEDVLGLMNAVPTAVHVGYYGERVVQLARRRAIAKTASELVRRAYGDEEQTDTGDLVALLRDTIAPFEPVDEQATAPFGVMAEESIYHSLAAWDGAVDERIIPTGIRKLDEILGGGLRRKQLMILGARPSMGKSALMVQLGLATRSHLVSLEMNRDEIVQRMIAQIANVPYSVGSAPIGDLGLRQRWLNAAERANEYPITITDRPQTTFQIETEVARLAAEQGTQLVVIDHLDWLGDRIKTDDLNIKTAALVRRCKAIAKACDVAVVVLSQLNRQVEHRSDFRPHLADFRNSGAVEQDADVAGLLYRRRYYSERGMLADDPLEDFFAGSNMQRAEFIIAKNRNGAADAVMLGWEPACMKFHERISA